MAILLEDMLQHGQGENALLVFRNDGGFHEVKGPLVSVDGAYAVVPGNGSAPVEFTAADVRLFERREYFIMGRIIYIDLGKMSERTPEPKTANPVLPGYGP